MDRLLIVPDEDSAIASIEQFDDRHRTILDHLNRRGASFHAALVSALPAVAADAVLDAVWDLVWAGIITNDTFASLRFLGERRPRPTPSARPRVSGLPEGDDAARSARRRMPRGW